MYGGRDRMSQSRWLILAAVLVALMLACACVGGIALVGLLSNTDTVAHSPASEARPPATAAPRPASERGAMSSTGPGTADAPVALVAGVSPKELSDTGAFSLRIGLENPTDRPVTVWTVAVTGDLSLLVMDVLTPPVPLVHATGEDGTAMVGIGVPDGLTIPPGESREIVFDGYAGFSGTYAGDVVICVSPEPTPETCAFVPHAIEVGYGE